MANKESDGLKGAQPLNKRTLYNTEDGSEVSIYTIDAAGYLRQKRDDGHPLWVDDPRKLPKSVAEKAGFSLGESSRIPERSGGAPAADDPKKEGGDPKKEGGEGEDKKTASWDDWSPEELLALANLHKIRDRKNKSRGDLVDALKKKGAKPTDGKPEPSTGEDEDEE